MREDEVERQSIPPETDEREELGPSEVGEAQPSEDEFGPTEIERGEQGTADLEPEPDQDRGAGIEHE